MTHQNQIPLHKITKATPGQITTFGWIQSIRHQGKITFIDLYFQFKVMKCVFMQGKDNKKCDLTPHSSLSIIGTVQENKTKDRFEFEFLVDDWQVYKRAPAFPLNNESSTHTQLEYGHLALQTKERMLFLQARHELSYLFRNWYYDNEYVEITPPTIVQTQVEGGATLFKMNYYGEEAYLTQSSQLYLETVVPATGRAFCIAQSYRAEQFNTTRHLSEYTHIEAELANITFNDLLSEIEGLLRHVMVKFYDKFYEKLKGMDQDYVRISDGAFKRVSYFQAILLLNSYRVYKDKDNMVPYAFGDDIADRDEILLVRILGNVPVFLTHFPIEHKPFYCRKSDNDQIFDEYTDMFKNKSELCDLMGDLTVNNDSVCGDSLLDKLKKAKIESKADLLPYLNGLSGKVTESVDLLFPEIGEIVGGSMRAEHKDELIQGFEREGIKDVEKYMWYIDLREYGASRHGGYGLGFERIIKTLMGYKTVNKACLYPRFPGRCQP